jgi:hypothetical protein
MKKPRGAKPDDTGLRNEPTKSQRRILRVVSDWAHVSHIVAAGGKPDLDDIAYLLRLGEPVPPDVQYHLADRLDPPAAGKGRPKKQPSQIEYDRSTAALRLYTAISDIQRDTKLPVAKACAAYAAAIGKGGSAASIERQYWEAKKRLADDKKRLAAALPPNTFLSYDDYLVWELRNLKNNEK